MLEIEKWNDRSCYVCAINYVSQFRPKKSTFLEIMSLFRKDPLKNKYVPIIFFDQTWKRLSISLLSIKWLSVRDVLLVERRPTTPALELSSAPFSKARNKMIEFGKIALLASVIHMYNCNGLWVRLYGFGVCYFVWLYFHHILDKLQSCPCI